ncbi:MAG: hypothetical protein RLN81_00235 [Balneolaceae bacterium]
MIAFFETTIGKIILVIIVILVWGVNVVNFSAMNSDEGAIALQEVRSINMTELTVPDREVYEYSSSSRNPFTLNRTRAIEPTIVPETNTNEPEFQWPRLSLAGILDGMVVISDEWGQSFFLRKGESFLNDIKVKEIVKDSVILEHDKKELILKLN